jgi:hypothetical protein
MRSNNKVLVLVLGTALAAVCTGACKKSAEAERREAEKAQVQGERKMIEAHKEAIDETNDYLAAVRREQLELRGRLQEEIDDIDKKLSDLKVDARKAGGVVIEPGSKDAAKIQKLLDRRSTLEADMTVLERADERGWDEVKANIEQDLGGRKPGKI